MRTALHDRRAEKIVASLPVEEKFFAWVLIILDGVLAGLAYNLSGSLRLALGLAGMFVILVIAVMVWWTRVDQNRRIHAEKISQNLQETDKFAESLADDICDTFQGSLYIDERLDEEQQDAERELPYQMLCSAISNREALSETEKRFIDLLVRRIKKLRQANQEQAARERLRIRVNARTSH